MKGNVMQGTVIKARSKGMATLMMTPNAKNLKGQSGSIGSKKSSSSAGFSTSKKCGSVKGSTGS
jgi:hypothetical protein